MEEEDEDSLLILPGSTMPSVYSAPTGTLISGESAPTLLAHDVLVDDYDRGPLWMSNYRLMYFSSGSTRSLPLMSIHRVTRAPEWIDILCRDVRHIRIRKPGGMGGDTDTSMEQLVAQLRSATSPESGELLFARSPSAIPSTRSPFDIVAEYTRLGMNSSSVAASRWRISSVNAQYNVCASYPANIIVPVGVHDTAIRNIAGYRGRGRLPATTWLRHTGPETTVALLRAAQPHVGIGNKRCLEEEHLVREVRAASGRPRMQVYDARTYARAMANMARGGGTENIQHHYTDCDHAFLNLPNMHAISTSYEAILCACRQHADDSKWHTIIENTKWTQYLSLLLTAARTIAVKLDVEKTSCLVHCTDGWDRTAQLVSLAQILIDPYYRTINGFIVLIEKDWLNFGHLFAHRYGQPSCSGRGRAAEDEQAPIFTQFLHAVYVLVCQAPTAFQFGPSLLLELARHVTSCRFATFLGNSEADRSRMPVRGPSLWDYIEENRSVLVNTQYADPSAGGMSSLVHHVQTPARVIAFWNEYFIDMPDEGSGIAAVPALSAVEQARQVVLMRQATAMRQRNLERHRRRLMQKALRALQDHATRRKLVRAEGMLVVRDIMDTIVQNVLGIIVYEGASWQAVETPSSSLSVENFDIHSLTASLTEDMPMDSGAFTEESLMESYQTGERHPSISHEDFVMV